MNLLDTDRIDHVAMDMTLQQHVLAVIVLAKHWRHLVCPVSTVLRSRFSRKNSWDDDFLLRGENDRHIILLI